MSELCLSARNGVLLPIAAKHVLIHLQPILTVRLHSVRLSKFKKIHLPATPKSSYALFLLANVRQLNPNLILC